MVPLGYPPEGSKDSRSLGYIVPDVAYAALKDWIFSIDKVLPPGAVAEPRVDPLPASGSALIFEPGLDADPCPPVSLDGVAGTPPDTEPGSNPERAPGAELTACLPFPCLGDLEKREWDELPSVCPLPFAAAESLLCVGLALIFKGIFFFYMAKYNIWKETVKAENMLMSFVDNRVSKGHVLASQFSPVHDWLFRAWGWLLFSPIWGKQQSLLAAGLPDTQVSGLVISATVQDIMDSKKVKVRQII